MRLIGGEDGLMMKMMVMMMIWEKMWIDRWKPSTRYVIFPRGHLLTVLNLVLIQDAMDGDDDDEEEEEEEEASSTRGQGQQRSLALLGSSPVPSSARTSPTSVGMPYTPQEKSPISPGQYTASPVYSNNGGSRLRVVRQWVPRPEVWAGATH